MLKKLATIAALTVLLGGCSVSSDPDQGAPAIPEENVESQSLDRDTPSTSAEDTEQSVETACALIETSMEDLAVELQQNDPEQDVQEMVDAALRHLDRLSTEITNPEVAAVWSPISDLQKIGLVAAAEGDDEAAVTAHLEMTDAYELFWEVCPPSDQG